MKEIQVRINEAGAIRNQRFAFTNRDTLVTELLQNARRAGATEIHVDYDEEDAVLSVKDDGCGINDFQKLLTFHESGWDAATLAEHPFGVGFTQCLYSAKRCIVHSGNHGVDIDTESALAGHPVPVTPLPAGERVRGSHVILHGVNNPDLVRRMDRICQGFAVPVFVNGRALPRPYAQSNVDALPCPVGSIHLAGRQTGQSTRGMLVFLQGFEVLRIGYHQMDTNVVHLDPGRFMARLPDRDKLIDEDAQLLSICNAVQDCWRSVLIDAKAGLKEQEFVQRFAGTMAQWDHLDLLNDLDTLPHGCLSAITGYPVQAGDEFTYLRNVEPLPLRGGIERGGIRIAALCGFDEDNAAQWMFARAKNVLVYNAGSLHGGHWLHAHVKDLEGAEATVERLAPLEDTFLEGRHVWHHVKLCEAVRITIDGDSVDLRKESLFHRNEILVPAGDESGRAVRQASHYTDDMERFLEADCIADEEALAMLIRRVRSVDPVQTLTSLLRSHRLGGYPVLRQQSFIVTVGLSASDDIAVALAA